MVLVTTDRTCLPHYSAPCLITIQESTRLHPKEPFILGNWTPIESLYVPTKQTAFWVAPDDTGQDLPTAATRCSSSRVGTGWLQFCWHHASLPPARFLNFRSPISQAHSCVFQIRGFCRKFKAPLLVSVLSETPREGHRGVQWNEPLQFSLKVRAGLNFILYLVLAAAPWENVLSHSIYYRHLDPPVLLSSSVYEAEKSYQEAHHNPWCDWISTKAPESQRWQMCIPARAVLHSFSFSNSKWTFRASWPCEAKSCVPWDHFIPFSLPLRPPHQIKSRVRASFWHIPFRKWWE